MAYRMGNRNQTQLFPPSIEELISEDDACRVYDEFVESLNLEDLGFGINPSKEGCPEYDPKSMLKVMLYGYSYGIRSSRRLERALHHNITFIWLSGGLKPDHKTIALFRKRNNKTLKNVFKQCVKLCIKLNVINGTILYLDGTKIKGNASIDESYDNSRCQKDLAKIDKRIDQILKECDKQDKEEADQGSWIKLNEELSTIKKRRFKIQKALQELKESDQKTINLTDSDAQKLRTKKGGIAGYNAQVIVDDEHGLIVNEDVCLDHNDSNQLSTQYKQAQDILEKPTKTICADKGYSNLEESKAVIEQGATVILPAISYLGRKNMPPEFQFSSFKYNSKKDCYTCPKGHHLTHTCTYKKSGRRQYDMKSPHTCLSCLHFGTCTTSKTGRRIHRHPLEEIREKLNRWVESDIGKKILSKRKAKAELPFAHIKHNLKVSSFLLRGLDGVKTELSILATVSNIRRLMTILNPQHLRTLMAA